MAVQVILTDADYVSHISSAQLYLGTHVQFTMSTTQEAGGETVAVIASKQVVSRSIHIVAEIQK